MIAILMEQWNFSIKVYLDDPSLQWIHEVAEIECHISVECELDFGQEESYWGGPGRRRHSNLIDAKLDEINFLPHDSDDEEAELKFKVLLTDDIRKDIESLAIKKIWDEWASRYSDEAFETCDNYHRYED